MTGVGLEWHVSGHVLPLSSARQPDYFLLLVDLVGAYEAPLGVPQVANAILQFLQIKFYLREPIYF